jgi:hypothetical protein
VEGDAQTAFEVITRDITSPFARLLVLNELLFVPTSPPFSFHWYEGVVPPLVGVAMKVTGIPGQTSGVVVNAGEVDIILTEGTTTGFTVMVISEDEAVSGLPQASLDVNTTETFWPLVSEEEENVLPVPATFNPFTFHWYKGFTPPFAGVAVKVTRVPAHIVLAEAEILTLTGNIGLTVMEIPALVAGLPDEQVSLELSVTVIISLLARALVVKVALLDPVFTPFTFH